MPQVRFLKNEPLSKHTTWRVGGPAAYFIVVHNPSQLEEALRFGREKGLDYFVIGAGSNLLVSDEGYKGLVIKLGDGFGKASVTGEHIRAGAATSLSGLAHLAGRHGLAGLSFAVGIPGTLGGALCLNAGAHGGTIGDLVEEVELYSPENGLIIIKREEISFGYRQSFLRRSLSRAPSRDSGQALQESGILTNANLRLKPGDPDKIKDEMRSFLERRRLTQPVQALTAGSVFKNFPDGHAASLIDGAGCRGMRVGDAVISDKHGNFIINRGEATAADIYRLLKTVQARVEERFGILLEPEIITLGEFDE